MRRVKDYDKYFKEDESVIRWDADFTETTVNNLNALLCSDSDGNPTKITPTNLLAGYQVKSLTAGSNVTLSSSNGNWTISATGGGGGGGGAWGEITGNIYDQTDLTGYVTGFFNGYSVKSIQAGANINVANNAGVWTISATGSLATVAWGGITGTLSQQTDLNNKFTGVDTKFGDYYTKTQTDGKFSDYTVKNILAGGGIALSNSSGNWTISATGSVSMQWGDIGGNISNQSDLMQVFDTKQDNLPDLSITETTNELYYRWGPAGTNYSGKEISFHFTSFSFDISGPKVIPIDIGMDYKTSSSINEPKGTIAVKGFYDSTHPTTATITKILSASNLLNDNFCLTNNDFVFAWKKVTGDDGRVRLDFDYESMEIKGRSISISQGANFGIATFNGSVDFKSGFTVEGGILTNADYFNIKTYKGDGGDLRGEITTGNINAISVTSNSLYLPSAGSNTGKRLLQTFDVNINEDVPCFGSFSSNYFAISGSKRIYVTKAGAVQAMKDVFHDEDFYFDGDPEDEDVKLMTHANHIGYKAGSTHKWKDWNSANNTRTLRFGNFRLAYLPAENITIMKKDWYPGDNPPYKWWIVREYEIAPQGEALSFWWEDEPGVHTISNLWQYVPKTNWDGDWIINPEAVIPEELQPYLKDNGIEFPDTVDFQHLELFDYERLTHTADWGEFVQYERYDMTIDTMFSHVQGDVDRIVNNKINNVQIDVNNLRTDMNNGLANKYSKTQQVSIDSSGVKVRASSGNGCTVGLFDNGQDHGGEYTTAGLQKNNDGASRIVVRALSAYKFGYYEHHVPSWRDFDKTVFEVKQNPAQDYYDERIITLKSNILEKIANLEEKIKLLENASATTH